jgi:hypothetical protein
MSSRTGSGQVRFERHRDTTTGKAHAKAAGKATKRAHINARPRIAAAPRLAVAQDLTTTNQHDPVLAFEP